MFKRLTAILITLAMLFGMCAVVTADTTDPYEYLPRNITIVCYDSSHNGAVVTWKNPTSVLLTKVTVTDTGNNAVLGTVESPTPGGISRVESQTVSEKANHYKVKFLFEFSNGEKREFYYTQFKLSYSLKNDYYTTPIVAVDGNNDYNVFTTNTQNTTENGKNSLMVVSNINPEVNNNLAKIVFNYKATASNFTTVGALKRDTTYNFEYKVKTDTDITFDNHINSGGGTMQNNSGTANVKASTEWQTVSGSFNTTDKDITGWMFFVIGFKQATNEPFYIDDVKITELDSEGNAYTGTDSTSYTYDFEDLTKTITKPMNVAASGSDGAATITWSVDSNTRYINVYEIVDGKKVLRNRMNGNPNSRDSSVDIHYLTNGKTYKFAVSAMTFEGIESEAVEVTVTPEKQVISKYEYEPANVMITGWRSGYDAGKGYAISWINPRSDKLSSVKLYEVNSDGTETEKTPNRMFKQGAYTSVTVLNQNLVNDVTTPSAVIRFENQGLNAESGIATYHLVFEFSNGQKRDIVYTGEWKSKDIYEIVQKTEKAGTIGCYDGNDRGQINANGSQDTLASASTAKISQKQVKEGSQVSLELYSNQTTDGKGRQLNISLNQNLVSGKVYNFSMDVNTIEASGVTIGGTYAADTSPLPGNILPNTNGKWQTVTGRFTANNTAFTLYPGASIRETYIDNIKVWGNEIEESDPATYSFSNVEKSAPEDVSGVSATQGEKTSTTISWDAASGGGQYVNVYEDIDKNTTDDVHTWMFRARAPKAQANVKLNNLETDSTHNFMVVTEKSGAQYNGLESAGVTCSATLVMPDYEINDVKLLANDEEVENFIPGGTYTAQANVTNAKIDDGLKTQVIVAVYANGVLENCVVSDAKTVTKGASETINVPSFDIGNEDKIYTAKIMVWKGLESVTPLLKNSVTYTTAE